MINATPVRPLATAPTTGVQTPASSTTPTPTFTPKPKKKFSMKMILGLIVFLVVAVGSVAGFYLAQQQQDTRQQAAGGGSVPSCQSSGGSCLPSCFTGLAPIGKMNCSGSLTCCKPVSCPAGSTRINNTQCRCNDSGVTIPNGGSCPRTACPDGSTINGVDCKCDIGGRLVEPGGNCLAQGCPTYSAPSRESGRIGMCKCNETHSDGSYIMPGGSCPIKPPSCPTGTSPISLNNLDCECNSTGQIIGAGGTCAPVTSCSSYKKQGKCNQKDDSYTCIWTGSICLVPKVTNCNQYTNPATCKDISSTNKCVWENQTNSCVSDGAVGGATSCNDFTNQFACNNTTVGSCTWSQSNNICITRGDDKVCSTILNQQQCSAAVDGLGCLWNSGTNKCVAPTKCSDYSDLTECNSHASLPNATCTWSQSNNICITRGDDKVCSTILNQQQCGQSSDGIACSWNTTTNKCATSAIGGTPGGSCTIKALDRCTPGGATCCANGGVCQGVAGQEVCQIPETSPSTQCGTGTCTGWYGFKCTQIRTNAAGNPECNENGVLYTSRAAAIAHAGSCGQVDQVCVGGPKNNELCGDFTVFTQSCTSAPGASPSTPPVGPMCMSIAMNVNGTPASETNKAKIGSSINFTCGRVPGVTRYRFRVIEPDGTTVRLEATGRNSAAYVVTKAGRFGAQCSICTGADGNGCIEYEPKPRVGI